LFAECASEYIKSEFFNGANNFTIVFYMGYELSTDFAESCLADQNEKKCLSK